MSFELIWIIWHLNKDVLRIQMSVKHVLVSQCRKSVQGNCYVVQNI